jgi:integrase/recombinase XerC
MRLRGLSPASITQRRRALVRLELHLNRPLTEATEEDLYQWQSGLRGAPAYIANQIANAACFYKWAFEVAEIIPTNPARRLVRPKVPRNMPRPMSEDKLEVAISTALPDVKCWLTLGAYAGLRAGEMSRLRRVDVLDDVPEPALVVLGKGQKTRIVPASSIVIDALREYGMPSRGDVFRRRDGGPGAPSPARVSQLVNEHLHELGIEDTGHAGRHRYATRLFWASKDLRLVQEMLGHGDVATTAVYTAYEIETAAKFVEGIATVPRPVTRLSEARDVSKRERARSAGLVAASVSLRA